MARMDPYLGPRNRVCYGNAACEFPSCPGPGCPDPEFDPNCHQPDFHKRLTEKRWKLIRQNPCSKGTKSLNGCLFIDKPNKNVDQICVPELFDQGKSVYTKDYAFPISPDRIDDCCPADCNCMEKLPETPGNNTYRCREKPPSLGPIDEMTSYRYWFPPKPVPPRPQKRIQHWDPCECPLECATTSRLEYYPKKPIPNGPALASIIKNGVWSAAQLCQDFTDETTTATDFDRKFGRRPTELRNKPNLRLGCGPLNSETETASEFTPKESEKTEIPEWIDNETWLAPMIPLGNCTTYKHYYKPYPIPFGLTSDKVQSPDAIPFCTLNKLCYTCHDPCVDQRPPVELKDNDPWPYVKPCPIRYQENLSTDPCAPFRDFTTYKESYMARKRCFPLESFKPLPIYKPSVEPFVDCTTNRCSYPAYNWCQYKESKGNAGNPNGIYWGPFKCPPNEDKCLPRFPVPYGHPFKPYNERCPCGPFDDRPTYKRDFCFKNCEMLVKMNEDLCVRPEATPGESVYRHDFVNQHGKKAERMPPPTGKGHRCMHPSSIRDTNTLYRRDYTDFWKMIERGNLELYRGKPTTRIRRSRLGEQVSTQSQSQDTPEEGDIIYQPVYVRASKKRQDGLACQESNQSQGPNAGSTVDDVRPRRDSSFVKAQQQFRELQRCRESRYDSGQIILNIPTFQNKRFGVRDGYAGLQG